MAARSLSEQYTMCTVRECYIMSDANNVISL